MQAASPTAAIQMSCSRQQSSCLLHSPASFIKSAGCTQALPRADPQRQQPCHLACSDLYQQYGKEFFEGPVGSKVRALANSLLACGTFIACAGALFCMRLLGPAINKGYLWCPGPIEYMCASHTHTYAHTHTGFLTAVTGEIFSGSSFLAQFADHPQTVLVTVGLLTVATIIPIAKGTEGNYLSSL
eukprot:scaffold27635_cov20-Tisochrysis_lutea.AAC.2